MLGRRTFQIATSVVPLLTVLEVQLQQHQFDWWALGSAAIASALVAILHAGRTASDPPLVVLPKPGP